MTEYPNVEEMDRLWPDEGYAVVEMDEFKAPDDDDFMVNLGEFNEPEDVILPVKKDGYTYYVHGANGDSWGRTDWETFSSQ